MLRRGRQMMETEVQLPITPMLDMAFQLLAFFVFTFTPSALEEGAIDMNLPAVGEAQAKTPENVVPDVPSDVELPKDVDVTVRITSPKEGQERGDVNQIYVEYQRPASKVLIDLNEKEVQELPQEPAARRARRHEILAEKLREQLAAKRDRLENKDDIRIEPDAQLKTDVLLQVVDACLVKGAGFKKPSFAPPP
jgi:biopolymer transport protein ExbD